MGKKSSTAETSASVSAAASSSSSSPSSSSSAARLDPSLFHSYFSQPPSASAPKSILKPASKGRDGRPMRRLKDGRTVVRALAGQKEDEDDETDKLARRRGERFIGEKLGLRGAAGGETTTTAGKARAEKRDEDDPLGLGDPAFLPGGEFAHLVGLTGKGKKRTRSSTSSCKARRGVSKSEQRQSAARGTLPFSSARPAISFSTTTTTTTS
ncbi:hypothetical protein BDZ90DRAFT_76271 [Jaminaea rosea]|uniref:Uncharacterized protein n=1 Tax=Jaminaea rosea TaxID=1569628 RepID=A0A316UIL2_9BASI|nr:hypothetical protein BDZ90DRAFT_76271 [Jaminaea rosea]PWN25059.1 hypothetical protein BDZ90DRAFT_76271 [Jaminaea rosea]